MPKLNLTFKQSETEQSVLAQLKQNKLFSPLLDFMYKDEITLLAQNPKEQKFTVGELKNMLAYDEILDLFLVNEAQTLNLTAEILKDSEKITLQMPWLVKVSKKNLEKLWRLNKFYYNSAYLFHKFPGEKLLKNQDFFYPYCKHLFCWLCSKFCRTNRKYP